MIQRDLQSLVSNEAELREDVRTWMRSMYTCPDTSVTIKGGERSKDIRRYVKFIIGLRNEESALCSGVERREGVRCLRGGGNTVVSGRPFEAGL
jgi:hypothetical protein